ncbi:MAG: sigma-70 family RNA polymerase sigma factor [Spirochaetota bacterium]
MVNTEAALKERDIEKSGLNLYLGKIRSDRLLTADEEKLLSKRILEGDTRAREKLIRANLRLVVRIARGYLTSDMELLDLIQEGNVGLIKAAEKFDFSKNVRFSTYASFWIKQSIARALSNKSRLIKLPHRKEESLRKISKASQRLSKVIGRIPEVEELAEETLLKEEEIKKILRLPDRILSIDAAEESNHMPLRNILTDSSYDPGYIVMRNYLREKTREMLTILGENERNVLLLRYSFINGKKYTLKDIGAKLGISPETVRQIEIKALRKIREHFSDLKELLCV